MEKFIDSLNEILRENNVTIHEIEDNKILSKNGCYSYSRYNPSLRTLIKIANYLNVSIEYLIGIADVNNFREYDTKQNFYKKIKDVLKQNNLSETKFCKDLGISRTNFTRWKNGSDISLGLLVDFSNYFNYSLEEFLDKK